MNRTRILSPVTAFFFMAAILWFGCKKDEGTDAPPCNVTGVTLTYNANVKGIIDRRCLACHSGAGPGPHNYSTYEGIKPLLDAGDVLQRVVIDKDMPEGGGGMTQAERDSINCWIQAGYPKQ